MTRNLRRWILFSLVPVFGLGQTPSATPSAAVSEPDLKAVLARMDEAAKNFKSAQADVELEQYTALVEETSRQSGEIYFRRHAKDKDHGMDVALQISKPHPKQVVINGDTLAYYDPKTGQKTERNISNNRADVESVMNLGFGGRGQELLKDFDVKLIGWETVDGVHTAKLELAPKSDRLKQFFTRMLLWIDPARDVPLKQQRFQSSGDYDITRYSNIRVPGNIRDEVFRLKKAGGAE
jgi:outer membrane lipoprotein-sorting protein